MFQQIVVFKFYFMAFFVFFVFDFFFYYFFVFFSLTIFGLLFQ